MLIDVCCRELSARSARPGAIFPLPSPTPQSRPRTHGDPGARLGCACHSGASASQKYVFLTLHLTISAAHAWRSWSSSWLRLPLRVLIVLLFPHSVRPRLKKMYSSPYTSASMKILSPQSRLGSPFLPSARSRYEPYKLDYLWRCIRRTKNEDPLVKMRKSTAALAAYREQTRTESPDSIWSPPHAPSSSVRRLISELKEIRLFEAPPSPPSVSSSCSTSTARLWPAHFSEAHSSPVRPSAVHSSRARPSAACTSTHASRARPSAACTSTWAARTLPSVARTSSLRPEQHPPARARSKSQRQPPPSVKASATAFSGIPLQCPHGFARINHYPHGFERINRCPHGSERINHCPHGVERINRCPHGYVREVPVEIPYYDRSAYEDSVFEKADQLFHSFK
ncbi:hypothetical protein GGX14DRAFT_477621 [Mycena pura]|uniref:Uncharacterized protein n=1 Tax=Mycena pura TaxID=153505 RepID=A0AAD6USS4_9AGAR|nr:hypothetical protein GGX14DRAFT_477621 [Mycena pura]